MFLAGREVGLADHPIFWRWYTAFISHFIAIYELSARGHTATAARWSETERVVAEYKQTRAMADLGQFAGTA